MTNGTSVAVDIATQILIVTGLIGLSLVVFSLSVAVLCWMFTLVRKLWGSQKRIRGRLWRR